MGWLAGTISRTKICPMSKAWGNMAGSVKSYLWSKSVTKQEEYLRNYLVQISLLEKNSCAPSFTDEHLLSF